MQRVRHLLPLSLAYALVSGCSQGTGPAEAVEPGDPRPRYLPSAYSEAPVDIMTDAYGAFAGAPHAPRLGDMISDFSLPLAGGGTFSMADARAEGDVVVVFFRGFW